MSESNDNSSKEAFSPKVNLEKEEELKKRPCFEDWADKAIATREDYFAVRTNVIYYGVMSNLSYCRSLLIQLCKETNGLLKAHEPEFKDKQKEWWYYYRKIMTLRSFLLKYFDLPPPDWQNTLLPERLYCGVLLSEEDFAKFLTKEGSGLKVMPAESVKDYEENLKNNRNKDLEKALELDDMTISEEEKQYPELEHVSN